MEIPPNMSLPLETSHFITGIRSLHDQLLSCSDAFLNEAAINQQINLRAVQFFANWRNVLVESKQLLQLGICLRSVINVHFKGV